MADAPQKITADKLCVLTGLTDRRHRQLADDGYFPAPVGGEYLLSATIQGLFRFYREGRKETRDEMAQEKIGLTRAQREAQERENRRRSGQLAEAADVIQLVHRFCFAARQKILLASMPEEEKQAILVDLYGMRDADYTQMPADEKDPSP